MSILILTGRFRLGIMWLIATNSWQQMQNVLMGREIEIRPSEIDEVIDVEQDDLGS